MATSAPRVSVRLRSLDREATLDALDRGEADLAVGFLPRVRRWHERHALYRETHACLFSPERVDPGNQQFPIEKIPKVVGGVTEGCRAAGVALYGSIVNKTVPVSSP